MRIGVTAVLTDRSMSAPAFAVAAEERGYQSLYLPEHTHLPLTEAEPPALVGGVGLEEYRRSVDPFVALAGAAAVTRHISLGTGVCLVAQHDPIVLAKAIATLDRISGGRVVLGIGYGWNRQEAADHGLDFSLRREVTREKVLCMQNLWTSEQPEFHGHYVELPPCYSWPKPVQQPRVRTLVGAAAGPRTFAAVAELADGWMPIGGAGVAGAMAELRRVVSEAGRDPSGVEVVVFGSVPDGGKLDHYREIGVNEVVFRIVSAPDNEMLAALDHYSRYITDR